ncbi:NADP-dependent oxidoreductase [Yinghuangia soli]|uniref:NADP-dependent oxidoreductase n=1 Tax=Yinghuangia soli TaxID=2908204 RepID=A0AA41U4E8_9ACTN|nr:NADP-dependent oxidoreductase [Yinghuangia soli]MCF2532830.1 NADP-dependent oxidoreductase [Yinghuangia soli]
MSRAVQFTDYGSTDVLEVVEVPEEQLPQPGPGQVRIRAEAIGVNPLDWKIRSGVLSAVFPVAFPHVPGQDVAGVVDAVGEGVTAWSVGDEVFGMAARTYADHVVADADRLAAKPADMPWALAGALPTAADAAYRALAEVGIDEGAGTGAGDTVLVHAAAGGVGTLALQFARAAGARAIGTASEGNHDYVRSLGAEPVAYGPGLADRVRAVSAHGVDAAVDFIGGGVLADSVALAGGPDRVISIVDPVDAGANGVRFSSGHGGEDYLLRALAKAAHLHTAGTLTLPLAEVYPLEEAAAAHKASETGRIRGKLVLVTR